jgi:hypothetical protein
MGNFSCKVSCDCCKKDDLAKTMLLPKNIINPHLTNSEINEIKSNKTNHEIIGENQAFNMINTDNIIHQGVLVSNQK